MASLRKQDTLRIVSASPVFCNLLCLALLLSGCAGTLSWAPQATPQAPPTCPDQPDPAAPRTCPGTLEALLQVAQQAHAQENWLQEAQTLAWARRGLRQRDLQIELTRQEAQARGLAGDRDGARALLRQLWGDLEDPGAWDWPAQRVSRRHEALWALWTLARAQGDVPPLAEQAAHLLDLGRLGRHKQQQDLLELWTLVGWWDPSLWPAWSAQLPRLHRPRRKRPVPSDTAALPCQGPPCALARQIEAERALTLATHDPAAGLRALEQALERPGPWPTALHQRLCAEASRLATWQQEHARSRAWAQRSGPQRAWLLSLEALRRGDLAAALPWLRLSALQGGPRARERNLTLSASYPEARGLYWWAWAHRQLGQLPQATYLEALLRDRHPASYYSLLLGPPPPLSPSPGDARATLAGLRYGHYGWRAWRALPGQLERQRGRAEAIWARWLYAPSVDPARSSYLDHPGLEKPDPAPWLPLLAAQSRTGPVPAGLALALMRQESGLNPTRCSPSGACGLMQIKPAVARDLARRRQQPPPQDLLDPATNLRAGFWLLEHLQERHPDDWLSTLAAYNAGPGAVRRWRAQLPPQVDPALFLELMPEARTRSYVMGIVVRYGLYQLWLEPGPWRPPRP